MYLQINYLKTMSVWEGGIPVKDECAPYLGLWVNSLVGSSIFEIDLFLILPNAPHTRVGGESRLQTISVLQITVSCLKSFLSLLKDYARFK